jgi:hypothetical protein
MSNRIRDLCPRIRDRAGQVVFELAARGIAVCVVDTLRTPAEHERNVAAGVSWTKRSKHLPAVNCPACGSLPNSLGGKGLAHAFDIAPYEQYQLHGPDKVQWSANDPAWAIIGEEIKAVGLRWGGDWKQRDLGHGELPT